MGVKLKYIARGANMRRIYKDCANIDDRGVEVGALTGEHAWLVGIHEYGLDIEVTPKMRAYLHGQGLHLKESTTHIHIPERSFIRGGYDNGRDKVARYAARMMAQVAEGKLSADAFIKAVGITLQDAIREYAIDLNDPANHPFTIEQKGSSNPLIDSGDMTGSISWREAKA